MKQTEETALFTKEWRLQTRAPRPIGLAGDYLASRSTSSELALTIYELDERRLEFLR